MEEVISEIIAYALNTMEAFKEELMKSLGSEGDGGARMQARCSLGPRYGGANHHSRPSNVILTLFSDTEHVRIRE